MGVCWEGQIYVDLALPFGLRSAPKVFTAVADAIEWALTQAGAPPHIHYLDDYLFFLPPISTRQPGHCHTLLVSWTGSINPEN